MTSLMFVTPAWKRYELSDVCFRQRRLVIDELRSSGIDASCVVVSDDENLDLAVANGFYIVEQNNDWLGRKFNDGMEFAGKNGADWIVPIGSDSWIDPEYFSTFPQIGETRTSPLYAAVTSTTIAYLRVSANNGAGPYMLHRSILEPVGFRPAADTIKRGVDGSTLRGISSKQQINWERRNLHPMQYIGFRGYPTITSYSTLVRKCGVGEFSDPWKRLRTVYPADLVESARVALTQMEERNVG